MSFAALKKQSKAGSLTERLMKKVEKLNENNGLSPPQHVLKDPENDAQ